MSDVTHHHVILIADLLHSIVSEHQNVLAAARFHNTTATEQPDTNNGREWLVTW